jgi:hypothetical protein
MAIAFAAPSGLENVQGSFARALMFTGISPARGAGIINGDTFPTGIQNFGGVPLSIPTGPNNY